VSAAGALAGLRVLDLSMYLPGPYASMLLADLGADVIQIEPPGGDPARDVEPVDSGDSALHRWVARNKRAGEVDLKAAGGADLLLALVADADVVMEGFRPGVADRLGVGYAACRAIKADIIYCSLSGAGNQQGPPGGPGHDINYLAIAGFLSQVTDASGAPVPVAPPVGDIAAGLHAAVAILSAVYYRDAGGGGQYIDVSILGSALAMTGPQLVKALAIQPLSRSADHNLGADPAYHAYRTADGRYVVLGAFEQKFWVRFCDLVGRDDLVGRRHSDPQGTIAELGSMFTGKDRAHWLELLGSANVCFSPVNDVSEVIDDPSVVARGDFERMSTGAGTSSIQLRNPIRMSATSPVIRTAGPDRDPKAVPPTWLPRHSHRPATAGKP
jgi:alpha-methylacyl-CoA racemase